MATYRTTCRSCGGPLHVIAGRFHTPHMPLTPDGFSFSEAKAVDTEDETVHCERCDSRVPLADCTIQCTDCEDRGWGHFEGNNGPEIQACDCGKLPADEQAAAAHQIECGCGWGQSWYHHLYEVIVKVTVAAAPDQSTAVEEVISRVVGSDLPGLVTDMPSGGLMHVCSAETVATDAYDEHPSRKLLVELGVVDDE